MRRFRLVLVEPQHPANVGACARLAANFGVSDLWVIAPQCDWRSVEGRKMAVPPSDQIFDRIKETTQFTDAIYDAVAVVGFTSREGRKRPTEQFANLAPLAKPSSGPIALVFGNERTGLTNEHIAACTHIGKIPASSFLPSLNLSQAVAVVLARLYERFGNTACKPLPKTIRPATWAEREALWAHWRKALVAAGLVNSGNPERILGRIRGILNSCDLAHRDVQLLRGYLSKTILALDQRKNKSNPAMLNNT